MMNKSVSTPACTYIYALVKYAQTFILIYDEKLIVVAL